MMAHLHKNQIVIPEKQLRLFPVMMAPEAEVVLKKLSADYADSRRLKTYLKAMSQLNSGGHASHMDTGVDVQYVEQ